MMFTVLKLWIAFVALGNSRVVRAQSITTVQLDNATFVGAAGSASGTTQFLGIPFAQPPVGDLRLRLPKAVQPYTTGTYQATTFGNSCYQQAANFTPPDILSPEAKQFLQGFFPTSSNSSEDCLTINVFAPSTAKPGDKLPVVFWIYGGGFELGSSSVYDGSGTVARSIETGKPILFVSANYRLSGLGFLAGKQVKAAGVGNLGLHDQRQALRWIQKYISRFGGDPTRVTLWGQSAGAMSIGMQMVTNGGDTEGLFRGAFMHSGSPLPTGDILDGQNDYDALVSRVGCSTASDTLACLRTVPYAALTAALDQAPGFFSYQGTKLTWVPRADGVFLKKRPQELVAEGSVARVPFVSGECEDEGTLFSLTTLNVTTDAQFKTYVQNTFFPAASETELSALLSAYPQDPTVGSPFGTGNNNTLTPEYKRFSALQGDLLFQAPRRFLLQHAASKQNAWSFLYTRNKISDLGTAHGSDLFDVFGTGDLRDVIIEFTNSLQPNINDTTWPTWTSASPNMLQFQDNNTTTTVVIQDTYRAAPIKLMMNLSLEYPPL